MRVLVVGMNPSKKANSQALKRLREWTSYIGVEKFSFVNAVSTPGPVSKNMIDKSTLMEYTSTYDKVIALGNFASEALDSLSVSHYKLPHPSGLNRMINDRELVLDRLEECRKYLAI